MTQYAYCRPIYGRRDAPSGGDPAEQRQRLLVEGIDRSRIYQVSYGSHLSKPREWTALLKVVEPGDQVVVTDLAIFGPHVQDLLPRFVDLHSRGVGLFPLDVKGFKWLQFAGSHPDTMEHNIFMLCLQVLEDLASFEGRHTKRRFRTQEQEVSPVTRPRGRPTTVSLADLEHISALRTRGLSWERVSMRSGIPPTTARRHLNGMPRGGWPQVDPEPQGRDGG